MNSILKPPHALLPPARGNLLFIVGEPGMGKTLLAHSVLSTARLSKVLTEELYLNNSPTELLSKIEQLVSVARAQLRRRGQRDVLVLIDGFPVVEEDVLSKVASRLHSIMDKACAVIVTLRAEAEQLLEYMPEGRVVRGKDLLYALPPIPGEAALRLWNMTNGIPLLVMAHDEEAGRIDEHFLTTLGQLVVASVRRGIPRAEREVRVAMLLLGQGSITELQEVAPGADEETLSWLEAEAPLFGVRLYGGTFCCAALAENSALKACHAALRRLPDSFTEVEARVFETLLLRHDYMRAGICCSIIGPPDRRSRLALRQGAELAISGSAAVVSDAIRQAIQLGMQEEPGFACSRAMLQILDEPYEAARFAYVRLGVGDRQFGVRPAHAHLRLMMASRSLDAGQDFDIGVARPSGELSELLESHLLARRLIMHGEPTKAMEYLSTQSLSSDLATMPEVLLAGDMLVANLLCAHTKPTQAAGLLERMHVFLEQSGLRRLSSYARALGDVLAVLAGGVTSPATTKAIHLAGQYEDDALCAALLIVEAISDVRRSALPKAHVCFARAANLAKRQTCGCLRDWALLLDALALTEMGEEGAITSLLDGAFRDATTRDLARLLVAAGCDLSEGSSSSRAMRDGLDAETFPGIKLEKLSLIRLERDALWLVCILANDFGTPSALFRASLPPAWRHALERYGRGLVKQPVADTKAFENHDVPVTPEGAVSKETNGAVVDSNNQPFLDSPDCARVEICLLGGFHVSVDGYALPPEQVNRRRAQSLLALLAAREDHTMRRVEIVDDIWSLETLEEGLQRTYEATSSARTVLGARKLGFDPLLTHRSKETISLNANVVHCDVDEFERVAFACVSSDGRDERVVEDACKARELYAGDLDSAILPAVPWVSERRNRLREAFVDAMVAGARSALRLGRVRVALTLAQSADAYDDIREDVVSVLVRCLGAVGRLAEVRATFERYSYRVTRATGLPPSKELRRLVGELAPSGRGAGLPSKVYEGGFSGEKPVLEPAGGEEELIMAVA